MAANLLRPALIVLIILGVVLFRRWYPLRNVPGPFLAKFTNFWIAAQIWSGKIYHELMVELHEKYGPVVRWGPTRVSFSNPAALDPVMGTKAMLPKAESHGPMVIMVNGQEIISLIAVQDEKRMTAMKRQISAGFSQSTWLKQEPQIDNTLRQLTQSLEDRTGQEILLNKWLSYWAFDTISQMAFSDSRHYLDHGKDIDGLGAAILQRFDHWRKWFAVPWLERLIYKNPYARRVQRPSAPIAKLAMERVQQRQALMNEKNRDALESDLMGRFLAASEDAPGVISPSDVVSLTVSTLNAGSENVAISVCVTLLGLLEHPACMRALQQEILGANLSFPPSFKEVDKLPYLEACIQEATRLWMCSPTPKERNLDSGDAVICDVWIPRGTDLTVPASCTSRDKTMFAPNPDQFDPERWIHVDEHTRREMEKTAQVFSYGRRICMGRHLAFIEMKKVIATMLMKFSIEVFERPEHGYYMNTKYCTLKTRLALRN